MKEMGGNWRTLRLCIREYYGISKCFSVMMSADESALLLGDMCAELFSQEFWLQLSNDSEASIS